MQQPSQAGTTKAQKFEDEKRRIIQSCFAKVDPEGARTFLIQPPSWRAIIRVGADSVPGELAG